jgi:hypothetical protein
VPVAGTPDDLKRSSLKQKLPGARCGDEMRPAGYTDC